MLVGYLFLSVVFLGGFEVGFFLGGRGCFGLGFGLFCWVFLRNKIDDITHPIGKF